MFTAVTVLASTRTLGVTWVAAAMVISPVIARYLMTILFSVVSPPLGAPCAATRMFLSFQFDIPPPPRRENPRLDRRFGKGIVYMDVSYERQQSLSKGKKLRGSCVCCRVGIFLSLLSAAPGPSFFRPSYPGKP